MNPTLSRFRKSTLKAGVQKRPTNGNMFAGSLPSLIRVTTAATIFAVCLTTTWADDRADFFERRIRPLLIKHCVDCHGPDLQENNLRLDSRHQVLKGGKDSQPLIVPGNVAKSRLWQVVQYLPDDIQMPPEGRLSESEQDDLQTWIRNGAIWPESNAFGSADAIDPDAWKKHWAFQPITNPSRPEIGEPNWHPIDSFVRYELTQEFGNDVRFAPLATPRTLTRRISYAITGLPPNIEDLQAIEMITSPNQQWQWYNAYTDRLLNSAAFGERWGRYWLDIARYADTKGYVFQEDREYKNAWRYREWVIGSLNNDQPYHEFLKQQIAADQICDPKDQAQMAAMGFFTLGRRFLNNKHDIIDDRIDVLTKATLGLTVSCARCHDHKFDPIPTTDYYSLYSIFDSSEEPKDSMTLVDRPKPRQGFVFLRGSSGSRGQKVPRRYLTALSNDRTTPFKNGSGRLELAQKIASPDNPLTARVAVNRIWMRLFGRDLANSPSDFGIRTAEPRHLALLDHLASYFIKHNWSRKKLIAYITKSYAWRQSSDVNARQLERDPENRLFDRMPRRRLNFEAMRDSMLFVSGRLDRTIGGPSVEITANPTPPRKTIYARIDRQNLQNVFRTFDFASPDNHSPRRFETTVPQQALFQLNSDFVMQTARHLTENIGKETSAEEFTTELFLRILRRSPTEQERSIFVQFLNQQEPMPTTDTIANPEWQYGWGTLAEDESSVSHFKPFPVFTDGRWSGGADLPDKAIGWASLTKEGGHPGHGKRFSVIRRWVPPANGKISINGKLKHPSDNGDGVAGYIISNGKQIERRFVKQATRNIMVGSLDVRKGEPVDFVVTSGSGDNESHDGFQWNVEIRFFGVQQQTDFDSVRNFSGPPPERLSARAQLCQTLLMTNEFLFID